MPAPYEPVPDEDSVPDDDSDDDQPTEAYAEVGMAGRGSASVWQGRWPAYGACDPFEAQRPLQVRFNPAGDKVTVHIAPDGSVTTPTASVDPDFANEDPAVNSLQSCYEDLTLQPPRYENLAFGSEAPPLPP